MAASALGGREAFLVEEGAHVPIERGIEALEQRERIVRTMTRVARK